MPPTGANEGRGRVAQRYRIRLGTDPDSDRRGTIPPRHHEGLANPTGETETFEFTTPQADRSGHRAGGADGDTDDGCCPGHPSSDVDFGYR
jgi:hypothetical protein